MCLQHDAMNRYSSAINVSHSTTLKTVFMILLVFILSRTEICRNSGRVSRVKWISVGKSIVTQILIKKVKRFGMSIFFKAMIFYWFDMKTMTKYSIRIFRSFVGIRSAWKVVSSTFCSFRIVVGFSFCFRTRPKRKKPWKFFLFE